MNANFSKALLIVLAHEGGYVDHPKDPGGATNKGITLKTFRQYYGDIRTKADLENITDEQVARIYLRGYWDACKCDELPGGLDFVVFDCAVNSGPARAAKWLQTAAGVTADGIIGQKTIAAANKKDVGELLDAMAAVRLQFLHSLPTWPTFGKGWAKRVRGTDAFGYLLSAQNSIKFTLGA